MTGPAASGHGWRGRQHCWSGPVSQCPTSTRFRRQTLSDKQTNRRTSSSRITLLLQELNNQGIRTWSWKRRFWVATELRRRCSNRPTLITRHTLIWLGTKFVFLSLSGYRYLGDGGTDRREILHDGRYRSRTGLLPFWGGAPMGSPKSDILGLNFGHLTANISKMVSRTVKCQLELSARRELSENMSRGSSPQGIQIIRNFPTPVWRVF